MSILSVQARLAQIEQKLKAGGLSPEDKQKLEKEKASIELQLNINGAPKDDSDKGLKVEKTQKIDYNSP